MKKRCSRRRRGFSFAAFWAAVLLLLTACAPAASPGPQETRLDFFAMDTYISLRAWGSDREQRFFMPSSRLRKGAFCFLLPDGERGRLF